MIFDESAARALGLEKLDGLSAPLSALCAMATCDAAEISSRQRLIDAAGSDSALSALLGGLCAFYDLLKNAQSYDDTDFLSVRLSVHSVLDALTALKAQMPPLEGYARAHPMLKPVFAAFSGVAEASPFVGRMLGVSRDLEGREMQSVLLSVRLDEMLQARGYCLREISARPLRQRYCLNKDALCGLNLARPFETDGSLIANVWEDHTLINLFSRSLDLQDIKEGAARVRAFRAELGKAAVRGLAVMRKNAGQRLGAQFAPVMPYEPLIRLLYGGVCFKEACAGMGIPVCFPDIGRAERGLFSVRSLYNPILHRKLLALGRRATPLDIDLNPGGEMCLLTGANKSGKTTALQAVAAAQLLFQSGYPVPAERARLSPAPRIEALSTENELSDRERAVSCLSALPEHALVLCNELFSSMPHLREAKTSAAFLHALCARRARGFFVTHNFLLSSLYGKEGVFQGGALGSFVQPLDERGEPDFHLARRPPVTKSHALFAARSVGVDFRALREEFERK